MILNISFEDYLNINGISPSAFKSSDIITPAHFLENKKSKKFSSGTQKSIDVGQCAHTMLLQPELFNKEFFLVTEAMMPFNYKKNKDGISPNMTDANNNATITGFSLQHPNKTILLPFQTDSVLKMVDNVKKLKNIDKILDLSRGFVEQSLVAVAEFNEFGNLISILPASADHLEAKFEDLLAFNMLLIKTRPDYFDLTMTYNLDLKTSRDISPEGFSKETAARGYNMQLAFGIDLIKAEFDIYCDTCYIIAVENQPPYYAVRYNFTERAISEGRAEYYEKLQWIYKAYKENNFIGYEMYSDVADANGEITGALTLDMPSWYYYKRNKGL